MKEKIFNLFYFEEQDVIKKLGAVVHEFEGSDEEKRAFLLSSMESDSIICRSFSVPQKNSPLRHDRYQALCRVGRQLEVFEEIFQYFGAEREPLCCITPIVNGTLKVDVTINHSPLTYGKHQGHPKMGFGVMADYLEEYMTPNGLDLPRLINDDYFDAIRILFNHQRYVSCMKLIVSFIDTIAFVEYGDMRGNYEKWLTVYANLSSLKITPSQLWELRNSVLHMSNLDSRKILSGDEKRIGFFIAARATPAPMDATMQLFNLLDLIDVLAEAISRWIESINANNEKWVTFVERYDGIISDSRQAIGGKS